MDTSSQRHVVVIGAGIAGMEASAQLQGLGYAVTLLEEQPQTGGNLLTWDRLFPFKRPASEVLGELRSRLGGIHVLTSRRILNIEKLNAQFILTVNDGTVLTADAVLVATGFKPFDAYRKEEYGYGIYDNVFTSVDIERMFREERRILTRSGEVPRRVGFIHCVGSRDEKAGNRYCSKVCCVTAVKQASELKEMYPDCEVFCFYMDLRMFDRHYEQMYLDAQTRYGVTFVRGRLSEAAETIDKRIAIKVEDTLVGKPMKMTVDMLVLMVGMEGRTTQLYNSPTLGLSVGKDRFLNAVDEYTDNNLSRTEGVFLAGTCTGPKHIPEVLADAGAAALRIHRYLCQKA
ncbi:MAG: CoB--CoM heterodisulfide reductase iron-sulfur subunit A family protein [Bacteroidales bacterium]|nr:CoB--CoM heterodisulfide reductase iron-sulfur subunit A family protein [Bacteroidales bacterium]